MESIISGCGKFNRSKDKDLIEARSALVQAWKDDVERAFEKVDKNLPDMMARHIADICYRESEQLKKQITMERKIGEIFEYNGDWYQCVGQSGCGACSFRKNDTICHSLGCSKLVVRDSIPVIFKKLEKVGEPYAEGNSIVSERMFQKYRTYEKNFFLNERDLLFTSYGDIVSIEIKQTKEDMEEKGQCCDNRFEIIAKAKEALLKETNIARDEQEMALIDNILFRCWQMGWLKKYEEETKKPNLKEFDLKAAKQGKPVCTRDGRKARIICFDVKGDICPIIALVEENGMEVTKSYDMNGRANYKNADNYDLMMLPERNEENNG